MVGEPYVVTGCLESLNDKRQGNWDEEVTKLLDSNYRDWRHPIGTYMVPREFSYRKREPDDGEKAEKKFFDLLQSFGESRSEGMFVIHSYNFAEMISEWNEESKRMEKWWLTGERDFVVLHHKWGIIFFQVKAAMTKGEQFRKANKQLTKDMQSLQAFLNMDVKGKKKRDNNDELFKFPVFVVMPNCPHPCKPSAKPSNGVFKEDCENVNAFSEWWDNKVQRKTNANQEQFAHFVMRFVGMSHSFPYTLSKTINRDQKELEMCTKEQLSVLLSSVPEQWITGPAGSGKTWLLMKKVLMLAEKARLWGTQEKILVVCYNSPLCAMFAKRFEDGLINSLETGSLDEVLEVKTFETLLCEITMSKSGPSDQEKADHVAQALELLQTGTKHHQQYDHIFVDECQDLCGNKWPNLFEKLHKDENGDDDDDDDCSYSEPKHMWFLYDVNQYLRLAEVQCQRHRRSIKTSTKLNRVFRNTGNIFDQSRKYYRVAHPSAQPIELGHKVRGLEIKWDDSLTMGKNVKEDAGARCIEKHIKLLQRDKVEDKDICILTKNEEIRNGISSELEELGIESQNAEVLYSNFAPNKVVVESIRRFKGLESKVVVLYDPPFSQDQDQISRRSKELLYIAVSRCFCYLIVITTKCGSNALKSDEGINDQENKPRNGPLTKRGSETHSKSGPPEFSSKCLKRS